MRYNKYYCSDGETVTEIDISEHDRQVVEKAFGLFEKSANKHLQFTDDKYYNLAIKQMIEVSETIKEHWQ